MELMKNPEIFLEIPLNQAWPSQTESYSPDNITLMVLFYHSKKKQKKKSANNGRKKRLHSTLSVQPTEVGNSGRKFYIHIPR